MSIGPVTKCIPNKKTQKERTLFSINHGRHLITTDVKVTFSSFNHWIVQFKYSHIHTSAVRLHCVSVSLSPLNSFPFSALFLHPLSIVFSSIVVTLSQLLIFIKAMRKVRGGRIGRPLWAAGLSWFCKKNKMLSCIKKSPDTHSRIFSASCAVQYY